MNKTLIKDTLGLIFVVVAIVVTTIGIITFGVRPAAGQITSAVNGAWGAYTNYTFFATTSAQTVFATSTNATSTNLTTYQDANGRMDNGSFNIAGAKRVTLFFSRAWLSGTNVGTSTFRIEATPDGTNWYTFNKLVQSTSTTVQATTAFSGTTTQAFSMQLTDETYKAIRCIANVASTDGQNSCSAAASY